MVIDSKCIVTHVRKNGGVMEYARTHGALRVTPWELTPRRKGPEEKKGMFGDINEIDHT